ncbi:MAG: porin [Rhodospirillales bacterium]|nr:porin [Rhodospirillales bacterium]
MTVRSAILAGTILGAALRATGPAMAESTADLIRVQQAEINLLKAQLQRVEANVKALEAKEAAKQGATAGPPVAPKPAPRVTETSSHRFALESADGQYSVGLIGVIQADVGAYPGFHADSKVVGPQNLNAGFNARRARIGVTGKAGGDFSYSFIYDAGNSADTTPKGIEYAQVIYNGWKGVALELGYSSTYFTLDQATSANDLLFLERSTPTNIAINLNAGDFRSNVGARFFGDRYWVGGYITGPASGDAHSVAERIGAFQRATYQVLAEPDYTLHLGVAVDELLKAPNAGPGTPNAISLSDQPELRIDTTTFANTGTLGTIANPVTSGIVYNVEAAGNYRNLFFQGEYFHYQIDRRNLATADFDGGYAQVAYALTGETHKYNPASGSYQRLVPENAFSVKDGFPGAWEVAARVSYVDLNDHFIAGRSLASQPSAVDGGRQTSYTVALNWYPNNYLRFMLDYLHTDYARANPTAVAGAVLGAPVGASIDAVALRTQVAW